MYTAGKDGGGGSADSVQASATPQGGGSNGTLSGTFTTPTSPVNLTSDGTGDWAHWGLNSANSFDHKAGVTSQISNITQIGGGAINQFSNNPIAFSWSDGTPDASVTSTPTGIWVSGVGNGFQITAPADTTTRTLKVHVGLWKAQGQLQAVLSDGSAAAY